MSLDGDHCAPVTLDPYEVEDLYWVLGQLEEWLRWAPEELTAELGRHLDCAHADRALRHVVDTLGRFGVELRRRSQARA